MTISKLDLMKLAERFDSEFDPADYSEEELNVLLNKNAVNDNAKFRSDYFDYYDDIKYKYDIKKQSD